MILAYFGTGIPCAVYASKWGMTPAACDQLEEDVCSSIPLTATNALEAVSSMGSMLSWSLLLDFCQLLGILFHSSGSIWTHSWYDNQQTPQEQETDNLTSLHR